MAKKKPVKRTRTTVRRRVQQAKAPEPKGGITSVQYHIDGHPVDEDAFWAVARMRIEKEKQENERRNIEWRDALKRVGEWLIRQSEKE